MIINKKIFCLVVALGVVMNAGCITLATPVKSDKVASTAYSRQFKKHKHSAPVSQTNNQSVNTNQSQSNNQSINININPKTGNITSMQVVDNSILVQKDVPIPFVITEDLDSGNLEKGEHVSIRVLKDVIVDNMVIFKKDTKGYLTVRSAKRDRNLGKAGYIKFKAGYIPDVTGTSREVTFKQKYTGKNCKWSAAIGYAMIWNPIGWIVALKNGDPLYIKAGEEGIAENKEEFRILQKDCD